MAKVEWTILVDEDIPVKCAVCAEHDDVTEGKVVEDMIRGYHHVVKREQEGRPMGIGVNTRTGDAGFVEMPGRPTYPQQFPTGLGKDPSGKQKSVAEEFGLLRKLTEAREERDQKLLDGEWEEVKESEDDEV